MAATLFKRLAKEIERGGKKSVVLGLLLLGGMYSWVPMLSKALLPKRAIVAPPAVGNPTAAAPRPDSDDDDDALPRAALPATWKSLHRRLAESQTVRPVALDELVRDPFDQSWIRAMTPPPPAKPETEHVADPLPALTVAAILVRPDGGSAVINGEVYRVGDQVPRAGPVCYVITQILAEKIVLEREGNSFELAARPHERK